MRDEGDRPVEGSPLRPPCAASLILLLGGTSETGPLASAILARGMEVLISTATDAPLDLPSGARRRWGRLDARGLLDLCRTEGIRALVDAGHPFAVELHETIQEAARLSGLPLLRFLRAGAELEEDEGVHWVGDHEEAARVAFGFGRPVMLTTGSRNLAPYVRASRDTGLALHARVLDHAESLKSCRDAGLMERDLIAQRGPFDLEVNRRHLRETGAGVMVSKESGEAGGLDAKLEAARLEGVRMVLIRRPSAQGDASTPAALADQLVSTLTQR